MIEFAMGLASAIFVCIAIIVFLLLRDIRDIKDEVQERIRIHEDMWTVVDELKQRLDEYDRSE
jgi:hypothetical protein